MPFIYDIYSQVLFHGNCHLSLLTLAGLCNSRHRLGGWQGRWPRRWWPSPPWPAASPAAAGRYPERNTATLSQALQWLHNYISGQNFTENSYQFNRRYHDTSKCLKQIIVTLKFLECHIFDLIRFYFWINTFQDFLNSRALQGDPSFYELLTAWRWI